MFHYKIFFFSYFSKLNWCIDLHQKKNWCTNLCSVHRPSTKKTSAQTCVVCIDLQQRKTDAQTTTTHPPKLHIGRKNSHQNTTNHSKNCHQPINHHWPLKWQPPSTKNPNWKNQKKKKKRLEKPAKKQPPSTKKNLHELRLKTQETKNIFRKSKPNGGKIG